MPESSKPPSAAAPQDGALRRPAAVCLDSALARVGTPAVFAVLVLGIGIAVGSAPAIAQVKWVGPDGSVGYGDRPPPGARTIGPALAAPASATTDAAPAGAALPYALRQTSQRHPVTLYSTAGCSPCDDARAQLAARGIPHAERTIRTEADAAAFRALGFTDLSFPALQVGSERLSGFEAGQWHRLLDSAGYPKTSRLPSRWQSPLATALAEPDSGAQADTAAASGDRGPAEIDTQAASSATAASPADVSAPRAREETLARPDGRAAESALRF